MDDTARQFTTLTKVKRLRETKALDALQSARRELTRAEERLAQLAREAEESAAGLPARIHALYGEVIGQVVRQEALDAVKRRAGDLERAHLMLVDRRDRAGHMVEKRREGVREAADAYRHAQRKREKFDDLLADMVRSAAEAETARQEVEVEDLFALPRKRPAEA